MKISDDTKAKIQAEYAEWESQLWAGKSLKERQKLGQFATPPELTIKMLEKFDSIKDKDILDPTVGAGSLLAAAVIAGADPKRCYGIELDPEVLEIAKQRLGALGVPAANLKCGNALDSDAYDFEQDKLVDHDQEAVYISLGKRCTVQYLAFPTKQQKVFSIDLSTQTGKDKLKAVFRDIKTRNLWAIFGKHTKIAAKFPKAICMSMSALDKTVKEQKLNSYDDLVPFAESMQEDI